MLALEDKLRTLDWDQDWYLGKPSIEKPLEIIDRDSPDMKVYDPRPTQLYYAPCIV